MRAVIEPLAPTADDWQAFVASLRRYVQRRVDPTFADDVLGNILLRLVEHRDALQDADNPSAWMFRVAANAITDHYRRSATEARVLAESGADSLKDIPAPAASSRRAAPRTRNWLNVWFHSSAACRSPTRRLCY